MGMLNRLGDHLPECEPDLQLPDGSFIACICKQLADYDHRVFTDRTDHWNAALAAARDAVAADCMADHGYSPGQTCPYCTAAIAAIDALREKP